MVNTVVVAVGGDLTQNVEGTARAHRWLDLLDTGYIDALFAPSRQRDPGWRVLKTTTAVCGRSMRGDTRDQQSHGSFDVHPGSYGSTCTTSVALCERAW